MEGREQVLAAEHVLDGDDEEVAVGDGDALGRRITGNSTENYTSDAKGAKNS